MVKIHFLNVGHGDCTIMEHESGNITMIDINNGNEIDEESAAEIVEQLGYQPEALIKAIETSNLTPYEILQKAGYTRTLTNPVEFYKNNFGIQDIFRYIQTHPDMDHLRGLVALRAAGIGITNFWDTKHTKTQDDFWQNDESEWEEYLKHRTGERTLTVLNLYRGHSGKFYNDHPEPGKEGDGLYLLAPTPELTAEANRTEKWNNHSYVLLFIYKGVRIILGGDAESTVWDSIVEEYGADVLSCHVLKASHHGRNSGYHQKAVELMSPEYTIVSVGKKPETDASNKYKTYCNNVWSTRWKGNMTITIDDNGAYSVTCQYES